MAQGELQQLLTVVIRRQIRHVPRLQNAVQVFGTQFEAAVVCLKQIQLRQLAPTELRDPAQEVTHQRSVVRRLRQTGELPQQRFGVHQRLWQMSEHHSHLKRTRK
ncbi:hypothetical protein D3C87_1708170 [compost metagenome]